MRLLRRAAVACSSEVRLQTVVPYLSTLINHPSIVIRWDAVGQRCCCAFSYAAEAGFGGHNRCKSSRYCMSCCACCT